VNTLTLVAVLVIDMGCQTTYMQVHVQTNGGMDEYLCI